MVGGLTLVVAQMVGLALAAAALGWLLGWRMRRPRANAADHEDAIPPREPTPPTPPAAPAATGGRRYEPSKSTIRERL